MAGGHLLRAGSGRGTEGDGALCSVFINAIIDQIDQGRKMKGGDEFGSPVYCVSGGQTAKAG